MNYYGIIEDTRNSAAFCMNSFNSGGFPDITREDHLGRADDTRRDVISSYSSSSMILSNDQVEEILSEVPEPFRIIPRLSESLTEPDGQNYVIPASHMGRFFTSIITNKKQSKETFFAKYLKSEEQKLKQQQQQQRLVAKCGSDSTADESEINDDSDIDLKKNFIDEASQHEEETDCVTSGNSEFNDKDCIPWHGKTIKRGRYQYPVFYTEGKRHDPRKFVYHWFVGSLAAIEKEMDERGKGVLYIIKNTCGNRLCVNPAHLVLHYKIENHIEIRKEDQFTWQQCFSDPFFSFDWAEKEKNTESFFYKKKHDFKKSKDSKQQDQEENNNNNNENISESIVDFFLKPSYSTNLRINNDNKNNNNKRRKINIGVHHGSNSSSSSVTFSGRARNIFQNPASIAIQEKHTKTLERFLHANRKRNRVV